MVTYVTQFDPLDDVIDESVGQQVTLDLERGGKPVSTKLPVSDLHSHYAQCLRGVW